MNFNNFIKNEFSRLFENIAFKMEAEKLFVEGINEDKFFHIDNFINGITCTLFNKKLDVEANISIFNLNVNNLADIVKLYNINIILQKNQNKYNLLFLVKKPVIKEPIKNTPTEVSKLSNPINFVNKFTDMFNEKLYPIKYSNFIGGKIYLEKELDNLFKRDIAKGKRNKKNKIPKKEINELISNKCDNFDNINKNMNILKIYVFDIPELKLIENIFHIYYLILFNYILPNIFINFKNINKIEKININFNSLINKNKILKDSLDTIFFISKNENLYLNLLNVKNYLDKLPYQLDDIEVIVSK